MFGKKSKDAVEKVKVEVGEHASAYSEELDCTVRIGVAERKKGNGVYVYVKVCRGDGTFSRQFLALGNRHQAKCWLEAWPYISKKLPEIIKALPKDAPKHEEGEAQDTF